MPIIKNALSPDPSIPRIGSGSAAVAWVLGAALLATGAAAVFLTANGAGSVALIAAGTAFTLTAAWRHLPYTIKAGGYELIWTAAYESGRQQVVEDLDKSVENGEDIKVELERLKRETRLAETGQRLELLRMMADRGYLDSADIDIDSLLKTLRGETA